MTGVLAAKAAGIQNNDGLPCDVNPLDMDLVSSPDRHLEMIPAGQGARYNLWPKIAAMSVSDDG